MHKDVLENGNYCVHTMMSTDRMTDASLLNWCWHTHLNNSLCFTGVLGKDGMSIKDIVKILYLNRRI